MLGIMTRDIGIEGTSLSLSKGDVVVLSRLANLSEIDKAQYLAIEFDPDEELDNHPAEGLVITEDDFKPHKFYRVKLENDSDLSSPCEDDGQWTPYSFSTRHSNFCHPDNLPVKGIALRSKLRAGTAFPLSYYEHGGSLWMLKYGHQPAGVEYQWDGVRDAGILLWENPIGDLGPKTYEDRKKDAQSFLNVYNAWVNGQGLYYCIEDEAGDHIGSCGGYYLTDDDTGYIIDEIASEIAHDLGDCEDFEIVIEGVHEDLTTTTDLTAKVKEHAQANRNRAAQGAEQAGR